jgi:hypothetical protein
VRNSNGIMGATTTKIIHMGVRIVIAGVVVVMVMGHSPTIRSKVTKALKVTKVTMWMPDRGVTVTLQWG